MLRLWTEVELIVITYYYYYFVISTYMIWLQIFEHESVRQCHPIRDSCHSLINVTQTSSQTEIKKKNTA